MHQSMLRLLEFARKATAGSDHPVATMRDVGIRLGASSQVINNWTRRGMSQEGALKAEAVFGCSPQWLLTGAGRESSTAVAGSAPPTRQAQASIAQAVEVIGRELAEVKTATRKAVIGLLEGLIEDPADTASTAQQIAALLATAKRRAA